MADKQPPNVVEGATGDIEDELPATAKSAEDRKAASALANLDSTLDDASATNKNNVDQDAVSKAMKNLGGGAASAAAAASKTTTTTAPAPKKAVKVDAADVALLVDELELPKARATELLKSHDGDAVQAMRAYLKG